MKQLILPNFAKDPSEFGGRLLAGKRKRRRPLSPKLPIHLVIRSDRANLLRRERAIFYMARSLANRYKIIIYQQAILGNHVHYLVKIPSEEAYRAWIRLLTSKIAGLFKVKGALFSCRPYTRIVSWGKEFQIVTRYVEINILEACGIGRQKARALLSGNYQLHIGYS